MRISEILKTKAVTVSCELFPPKQGSELSNTRQIVREIAGLRPSFMSVTYGAGGSNSRNTLSVAEEVQKNGVTALAHLTCVGQDRASLRASIEQFRASGMENILALRGDIPAGQTAPEVFPHASDLIREIRAMGDFCIGGACYPEGHPESKNSVADIDGVRVEATAADFDITSEDMPGWLVATEGKLTVAMDITVTEELRREGVARELVNRIQNIRKESGFDVTDKIRVTIGRHEALAGAFGDYIAAQTLAVSVAMSDAPAMPGAQEVEIDDLKVGLSVEKA